MKNTFRSLLLVISIIIFSAALLLVACTGNGDGQDEITTAADAEASASENDTTAENIPEDTTQASVAKYQEGSFVTSSDFDALGYTYETITGDIEGMLLSNRDVLPDTWMGVDGAGRSMPAASSTPTANDRTVGIFYFLWRDADQNTLNPIPASDHYKAYLEGGKENLWEVMQEGGEGHPHYWAEPYFGYYSSNDEWVLRRHAYMFADSGIDFVFFDTTNNNLHLRTVWALLKVWEEVKQEGYDVPKICFLCGGFDGEFHDLYNSVYKPGLYEDLWFYWDDKPLVMLSGDVRMTSEEQDFFTVRFSWADHSQPWFTSRGGNGCWPWSDTYRQSFGYDYDHNKEQMIVMCAGGGQTGRSLVGGHYPKYEGSWDFGFALMESATPYGLMFAKYFDNALSKDPPLIMITGWNEWIAGRWSGAGAGAGAVGMKFANEYYVSNNPNDKEASYFVDQFDPEFSRDIEPMKDGFGDNYYYQMAQYIRQYKGSRQVESAFGQWSIDFEGSVGQWYAVGPEYRDYAGDITDRCSPGHVGGEQYGMYVNFSGRNDIVLSKVSTDGDYVYFYVECANEITAPEGSNWMNLFINSDCSGNTGWYGFDYIFNRTRNQDSVLVERFTGKDEWKFETVGTAEYKLSGKTLQIKVAKSLIDYNGTFDFKWADNSVPTGQIMEFLDQGDAAPNGRFTYRFTTETTDQKLPEGLTSDMVVLKSRSYNAFVGGKQVRLVDNNTNGVALMTASDGGILLPAKFMKDTLGISCEGEKVNNHYGIEYVRADRLIEKAGKCVTTTPEGLIVISDLAVDDQNLLTALYRALS